MTPPSPAFSRSRMRCRATRATALTVASSQSARHEAGRDLVPARFLFRPRSWVESCVSSAPDDENADMSENLVLLGAYSDAMARGDEQAVFEFWSPDFVSHVTRRVNPDL